MRLKDKVVVITGSTRGFGLATAIEMAKTGARVVLTGRSQISIDQAVNAVRPLGQVEGQLVDVQDSHQVVELAAGVVTKYGQIDVWINNAGYSSAAGALMDNSPQDVRDTFLTNDLGAFNGAQAALYSMLPRRQGLLVNIYGMGSFLQPASPTGLYGATKAWLTSFSRTLAKEIKGSGVRLLCFSPGMMLTDMLTNPTVIGERGKAMMKNYAFVLRFLGKPPQQAAQRLIFVIEHNDQEFSEVKLLKPWTPFLGILRVTVENMFHTGKTPAFELHYKEAYKIQ